MENEIANKLGHQEDRQAKVKMKSGEYDIRTKDFTDGRKESRFNSRISQIKVLMRAQRYCRHYMDVEKEIRKRQDGLRNGGGSGIQGIQGRPGGPPPIHF